MTASQPTRRWPRFSLRSLILFVALCSVGYGLWYRWEPWQRGLLLEGHSGYVLSAAFSPDGKRMVTASDDGTARVYDPRRPEYWYGVAWLPEFWVTLAIALALGYSGWRDWRALNLEL